MDGIWPIASGASWEDLSSLYGMVLGDVVSEATACRLAAEARWRSRADVTIEAALTAGDLALTEPAGAAHTLAAMALAIADGAAERDGATWRAAALAFVSTAGEALAEFPDCALLERSRVVEERLMLDVEGHEDEGIMLAIIGSARLAPFAFCLGYDSYVAQLGAWRLRWMLRNDVTGRDAVLPDTQAGLRDAASALDRAAELLTGARRARVLADVAYTRFTQLRNNVAVDRQRLISDCLEAWPLLSEYPFGQAEVLCALAAVDALEELDSPGLALAHADTMVRAGGLRRAAMAAIAAIRFCSDQSPAACRTIRAEMLTRLPSDRFEAERCWLEQAGAYLLEPNALASESDAATSLAEPAARGRASGADPALDRPDSEHLLADENIDVAKLTSVLETMPDDDPRHRALEVILAQRTSTSAEHLAAEAQHAQAAASFVHAAFLFVGLGYPERVLNALLSAYHNLELGPSEAAIAVLAQLRDRGDAITACLAGTEGLGLLRMLYGMVFIRLSEWANPERSTAEREVHAMTEGAVVAMQLGKGRAFSTALAEAGLVVDDDFMARTLTLASDLEAQMDSRDALLRQHPYEEITPEMFDEEAMLSTHWHPRQLAMGDDHAGAVANLRRRYQLVDQIRCATRCLLATTPYTADQLTAAIPPGVVLAAFYYWDVGNPPHPGFHCLLCTATGVSYIGVYDPSRSSLALGKITIRGEGSDFTSITYAEPGAHTAYVRRLIADDPLHGVASRETLEALEQSRGHYGPVVDALAGLRAREYRHLVIWPHGPQYLFPMHLVPTAPNRIIADDWTVTFVPSLESVVSRQSVPAATDIVVVASSVGGVRDGLPAEPLVLEQAQAVARQFDTRPLQPATRDRLRDAAQSARYLHIAAHGAFYHEAPIFHHLFLDDGPLYAHEVLKLDLRSVELVTVSACESALVRYDENDNVLGLPAAFLRAGARALVGVLWPIDPVTALDFFETLYRQLAAGTHKLEAFRTAQVQTRQAHAEYRDWGAFCMIGAWS